MLTARCCGFAVFQASDPGTIIAPVIGMSTVLAAIDLGPSSARILYHAAAFARLMSIELRVLHVVSGSATEERNRVLDFCRRHVPYEIDIDEQHVVVRSGLVSDVIQREALHAEARLVVMGSRGHGGLATFILGSTSRAVLQAAVTPVLLTPQVDLDIVSLADRPRLTCGPVLAAVDLREHCDQQLRLAACLAGMADQALLLMTVAPRNISEHVAAAMLRERAHLTTIRPRAMIVRHGDVAEEISRCAITEGAGLVVMGLRARPRGTPGAIASAVLKSRRAFVLAVPGGERGK